MQVRIRRNHAYGSHASPAASLPGSGSEPGRGVRSGDGPCREHHVPLQDLGDQRRRHEQGRRPETSKSDPPTVVTQGASSVTQTTATLNASVNPGGEELSECEFEYGTTTAYGSSAPCSSTPEGVEYPVRRVRIDHRPHRQHDLPLPHLGHQRERHEQGLRRNVQNVAELHGRRLLRDLHRPQQHRRKPQGTRSAGRRPEREHLGRGLGPRPRASSSTPNTNTSGSSARKAPEKASSRGSGASPQTQKATSTSPTTPTTACRSSPRRAPSSASSALRAPPPGSSCIPPASRSTRAATCGC